MWDVRNISLLKSWFGWSQEPRYLDIQSEDWVLVTVVFRELGQIQIFIYLGGILDFSLTFSIYLSLGLSSPILGQNFQELYLPQGAPPVLTSYYQLTFISQVAAYRCFPFQPDTEAIIKQGVLTSLWYFLASWGTLSFEYFLTSLLEQLIPQPCGQWS